MSVKEEKMQQLFNQNDANKRMMEAIHIINAFRDRLYPPSHDFLLDMSGNSDTLESLRLISETPKSYLIQPFELSLFPGTSMYTIAMEKWLIQNEHQQIYNRSYTIRKPSYLNLLFAFCRTGHFPHNLLKLLISKPALFLLNSFALLCLVRFLYVASKTIHNIKGNKPSAPALVSRLS